MANKFFRGALVQQKPTPPVQGTITHYSVDQETGDVQIAVEYETEEGTQTRFFTPDQIELVNGDTAVG